MSSQDGGRRPQTGEVLPPLREVAVNPLDVQQLPQGILGSSLFARIRYASEQRQIEAYTSLVASQNALARALNEQGVLVVEHGKLSERVRNLDAIRLTARAQINNELSAILGEGELAALRLEAERERLHLQIEQTRKARSDLNAPPRTPPAPKTTADLFREAGKSIEDTIRAFEEFKQGKIKEAGNEEALSASDKRLLQSLEVMKNRIVNDIVSGLG